MGFAPTRASGDTSSMREGPGGGGGPPRLDRVAAAAPAPPRASRGLAAPEVTAAAALAAGLAYEGALAKDGPLRLCYLAAAAQASGRLDLDADRARFALHFKRGVVEHAGSDAPEDDLGRFLVARGAVTEEAVADAERVRADLGGDLVGALTRLRLLNPAESFRVLQEHGTAVLTRALAADKGACRWSPGAPPPPSCFPLGSRWGVLCGAERRLDGLAVRKLLGERIQRVASRSGGRVEISELKLTAHEARAASLFDGRSSPAQLAAARPGEADTILRTALLLGEMELLAFGEVVTTPTATAPNPPPPPNPSPGTTPAPSSATARAPSPPRPPTPSSGAPAHQPSPPRTCPPDRDRGQGSAARPQVMQNAPRPSAQQAASARASADQPPPARAQGSNAPQDAAALRAAYERVRAADHFAALGVKQDATTQQIKIAYFQLAKTYHPDAGPPGESDEVKKLRADVFGRLGEAWAVLGEDAKRAEYLRELASGGAAEVDVSAIFKAEELFQKATVLVRTRRYDKALEALAEATKLNADEPEFGVWTAWVQFLVAQDQPRQHKASAAVIEAALKKVPRCMPGYLFLGQMARISGDIDLAERHFRRGLALDAEHAELVRELKYLRR